jgi:hypothetical protein
MGRRILVIVLVLVVALFAYLGYNSYDVRREGASGDVFSKDSPMEIQKTEKAVAALSGERPVVPPEASTVQPAQVTQEAPAAVSQAQMDGSGNAQANASGGDTISPNPPNGMVFSGTGKYQLYRQGNLTWRVNTESGQSCIIFATDEEWKKPKVYRAGCGRR